ncbi:MAG: hypothetical protein KGO96_13475 [Elusimicrobia bacterium]|nr:hypothetical protein [Elusimicrobiota bacterium]
MADLQNGWRDHPPVQWMLQAHWGFKPADAAEDDAEFDSMVAQMNGGA